MTARAGGSMGCLARLVRRCLFVCSLLGAALVSPAAQALEIALLLSEQKGAAQQFVHALQAALKPGMHRVVQAGAVRQGLQPEGVEGADLIVAAGRDAAEAALRDSDRPVLAALLGVRDVERLRAAYPNRRLGAVVLDQPPARHLRLVRAILPQEARVGALLGPDSRHFESELMRAGAAERFEVDVFEISDGRELNGALQFLLDKAGALLALPDGVVSSPNAARAILLTSYRYRRPIFAFSAAYVTAGALAAVFSTPEHIANDVADLLGTDLLSTGGVAQLASGVRYPERFDVAVNRTVARALGIAVPDDQVLRERVASRGEGRR
ncbi:ABC transporter substrate-binding protein [Thauera sp. WH-1]|uniref:ABC transporter substrate-binding protein n=1 Tax=Thauera sp. WH-1 TaxID=3398230 RepID=UPI0039FCD611